MAERTIDICGHQIRVLEQPDGSFLYNAQDLCDALGENLDDALAMIGRENVVVTHSGGDQN
jgi:prophage antirepressor-like protein